MTKTEYKKLVEKQMEREVELLAKRQEEIEAEARRALTNSVVFQARAMVLGSRLATAPHINHKELTKLFDIPPEDELMAARSLRIAADYLLYDALPRENEVVGRAVFHNTRRRLQDEEEREEERRREIIEQLEAQREFEREKELEKIAIERATSQFINSRGAMKRKAELTDNHVNQGGQKKVMTTRGDNHVLPAREEPVSPCPHSNDNVSHSEMCVDETTEDSQPAGTGAEEELTSNNQRVCASAVEQSAVTNEQGDMAQKTNVMGKDREVGDVDGRDNALESVDDLMDLGLFDDEIEMTSAPELTAMDNDTVSQVSVANAGQGMGENEQGGDGAEAAQE